MAGEPDEIQGRNLAAFLKTHQTCVVWVRPHLHAPFHKTLKFLFEEWYDANTAFVSTDSLAPEFSNAMTHLFGKSWMANLGIPNRPSAPDGYYLFQNGRVVGYYPQPNRYEKLSPEMRDELGRSIIVLAIYKMISERNFIKGIEILTDPPELLQALRMFLSVLEQMAKDTVSSSQEGQRGARYAAKLQEAYEQFGVSPTTTKEEVQRKYWELARAKYPLTDGPDSAAKSAEMAKINDLHDLLMKALGFE